MIFSSSSSFPLSNLRIRLGKKKAFLLWLRAKCLNSALSILKVRCKKEGLEIEMIGVGTSAEGEGGAGGRHGDAQEKMGGGSHT